MEKKYTVLANSLEWCKYSWSQRTQNVNYIHEPNPYSFHSIMWWIWKIFYGVMRKGIRLPYGKFLYPYMLKSYNLNANDENIIVVYDRNVLTLDFKFWNYLRKKLPNVKIVYLFSNIVKYTGAEEAGITNQLLDVFDQVFAFDKIDSEKYGFDYNPLIYTECKEIEPLDEKSDLFYLGNAKDRLPKLLEIYKKAVDLGLKCDFHIVGVPADQQKYAGSIVYNKPMSYKEAIRHIKATKCLVDAIQGDSTGLTIKTCESVIYNKKLITTNIHVKEECFYNENNIYIDGIDDNFEHFLRNEVITYKGIEKAIFSPQHLFDLIR